MSSSQQALPSFLSRVLGENGSAALAASARSLQSRENCRRAYEGQFSAAAAQNAYDKNRYGDILAFDRSRVRLPDSDSYINANWIHEPSSLLPGHVSKKRWLATQAPLPETLWDYWSLFLLLPPEDAPRKIVMLTALVEAARVKCERYFPAKVSDEPMRLHGNSSSDLPIEIRLLSSEKAHDTFLRNRLSVCFAKKKPVEIDHFECLVWHDHGVPDRPEDLLDLIESAKPKDGDPPTLVHCSAGVGRTGTFIATSILLDALPAMRKAEEKGKIKLNKPEIEQRGLPPLRAEDLEDPVVLTIDHLRAQRCLMVQTKEQQHFIYECLAKSW